MVINGKKQDVAKGKYGPNLHNQWLIDFLRRQNGKPFFAYYATTLTRMSRGTDAPGSKRVGSPPISNTLTRWSAA